MITDDVHLISYTSAATYPLNSYGNSTVILRFLQDCIEPSETFHFHMTTGAHQTHTASASAITEP